MKNKDKNEFPHGIGTLIQQRTNFSRNTIARAIRGESDSVRSREILRVAREIMQERNIA